MERNLSRSYNLLPPPHKEITMKQVLARSAPTIFVLILSSLAAFAQEFTPAQNEVWGGEEAYWSNLKSSNVEAFIKLWHEKFLGWPRDRELPIGKDDIAQTARKKLAESRIVNYQFLSKAVTVIGNVGVTQYSVKATRTDSGGQTQASTTRITHTWLKTGTTWQIIGGMSAPLESSGRTW